MTTANKITIFRVLLIPVMLILIYIPALNEMQSILNMNLAQLLFAIIFVVASATDFIDGYVARKYNQITTFGKFLDPIADKVLVLTAFLYLMTLTDRVPIWAVMVVIIREFMVTGIRLLAVEKGTVIAASKYGKLKTVVTMVALIWLLFNDFTLPLIIGDILFYLAIALTVISGLEYLLKNKEVVLESI